MKIIKSGKRIYCESKTKRMYLIYLTKYERPSLFTRDYIILNKKTKDMIIITPMNIFDDDIEKEVIEFCKKLILSNLENYLDGKVEILEFKAPCYIEI